MKKFKARSMDLKTMSDIKGGDINVTLKDLVVKTTKASKQAIATETNLTIEVSGTITIEN